MSRNAIVLLLSGCALALLSSCATPGAPMPPSLQLPRPVEDLNFVRKGARVVLTWTPPSQTTEHIGLKHSGTTYICRSVGKYPVDSCDMVKRLSPDEVAHVTDKKREQAVFEDVLPADSISPAAFATYSIDVFNDRGRTAGLSNQVRVPLAPTLPPPQDLRATVTSQGPVLQWTAAQPSAVAGLVFEYRVMRRLEGSPTFSQVQDTRDDSAGPKSLADQSFEWEKNYDYKLVPITQITSTTGSPVEIEGEDSPIVSVIAKDVFPPDRPAGVQAVFSSVGQKPFIDLTWNPNGETDLAGYDVYRREANTEPVKITAQPAKAPSFRDENTKPGTKYFYSVVAIDLRGNQSTRSEEASESVPADIR
jgi:hypothetical protein